ncbi:MAG: site-specific DNA-methyltransferase [candidate division WOR-3 bacterium]
MPKTIEDFKNKIICGDSLEVLKEIPDNSIDCIVTDPPAGIGFMGQEWDIFTKRIAKPKKEKNKHPAFKNHSYDWSGNPYSKQVRENFISWLQKIAEECLRVLKPGGHALVWALPKTSHWTATAWENAGFEVRDRIIYVTSKQELLNQFLETLDENQRKMFWVLMDESRVEHCFGQGFPKSLNIANQISKKEGAKREEMKRRGAGTRGNTFILEREYREYVLTENAKQWEGWGTALKPAVEDWWLLRKPLEKGLNVAENVLKWGTGGINIDKCRIPLITGENTSRKLYNNPSWKNSSKLGQGSVTDDWEKGRFPSHLIIDDSEEVMGLFPNNAHRFFYCAKASRKEREVGLEEMPETTINDGRKKQIDNPYQRGKAIRYNSHPTVKPIKLMEYLIKLICPQKGIVLDLFMGSGSTGVAAVNLSRNFIGIEKEKDYFEIAKKRIEYYIKEKSKKLF